MLPKSYQRIDNATLVELLKIMSSIPTNIGGDAFGKIYEYFLGAFAMKEGQKRRRILHAVLDGQPDRRGHRAVSRSAL